MNEIPFAVPGGWTNRVVQLAGRDYDLLVPAEPDSVLESAAEAEQRAAPPSASDPYWATLWSSAVPTAEMVLENAWRGDESVLEIGCGMGLVGLAALARGLSVTFSDYVSEAVQLAVDNARRNGFPAARGCTVDWQQPPSPAPSQRYAVIVGSDILYHRGNHLPILNAVEQLLAEDGVCWIGDPGRYDSHEFLSLARRRFHVVLRDRSGNDLTTTQIGRFQLFVLQHREGRVRGEG